MAETWDETKPSGSRNPKLGDDDMREFKTAIRERLAEDHVFESTETTAFGETGSQIGHHKKCVFPEQSSDPVTAADEVALYSKEVGGVSTLVGRHESSGGLFRPDCFPAGTVMVFGQNSAPTGWTRKTDWQDGAMLCFSGSGDPGSGGSQSPQSMEHAHASGSLRFTVARMHSTGYGLSFYDSDGDLVSGVVEPTDAALSGSGDNVMELNTA